MLDSNLMFGVHFHIKKYPHEVKLNSVLEVDCQVEIKIKSYYYYTYGERWNSPTFFLSKKC